MSEGMALFPCASTTRRTCAWIPAAGRCRPTTRSGWVDEEGREVARGEVGGSPAAGPTLAWYYGVPEYNARSLRPRASTVRRPDAPATLPETTWSKAGRRTLSTAGGERSAPRRSENLILGTPRCKTSMRADADPHLGEKMCACSNPEERP